MTVEGSSDSSFALAHSTTGYVFELANAAVTWLSKKQETIAISPQHAEVTAGSVGACEGVSLRGILAELGHPQTVPTILKMDCSSAIDLASDPVSHSKSKHIHRRDLFIRELVDRGEIEVRHVPTAKNVADILTKPLQRGPFLTHRATLLGTS